MLVRTTYLEQRSPTRLRPAALPGTPPEIVRVEIPAPEFGRFLYATVGGDWHWRDRLPWTREQWLAHLSRPRVETWVAYLQGTPAGYFELDGSSTSDVEIAYFGLMPGFLGRGLGGYLLTAALRQAWSLADRWPAADVTRVWVHTCSLDAPGALPNYRARGLTVYRTEETEEDVPGSPPGSWPAST
jgi:GNAT superfamily N-acetyltransferase